MKQQSTFLCVLLIALLVGATSLSAAPVENRYTDLEHGFSLVPPPNWTIDTKLIPHYAVFVEPSATPATPVGKANVTNGTKSSPNASPKTNSNFSSNSTAKTAPKPSPKQLTPDASPATISTYGAATANMTQDQYLLATRNEIVKETGMKIYAEKALKLDGANAYSWRMHVNLPGQPPSENRQVFCVHNGQVTVLTLTTTPAAIHKHDAAFEKTLASFRWVTSPPKTSPTKS